MDLGECVPPGVYGCWRIVTTIQPNVYGWRTDTSGPYISRDGAMAGAANKRAEVDKSRGSAIQSPWHQTNMASSQMVGLFPLDQDQGEVAWENSWGETVTIRRSSIVINA